MFKINCSGFQEVTQKEPFNGFHFDLKFLFRVMKQMEKKYYKCPRQRQSLKLPSAEYTCLEIVAVSQLTACNSKLSAVEFQQLMVKHLTSSKPVQPALWGAPLTTHPYEDCDECWGTCGSGSMLNVCTQMTGDVG